jgi:hypothetical protein
MPVAAVRTKGNGVKTTPEHTNPPKTVGAHLLRAFREAHARRPASFYLLLAIPLVMLLGFHMVLFTGNPKRFAFILSLLFIFFGVAVFRALLDAIEIARSHFSGQRQVFRETLGDDDFMRTLGERVDQGRKS